MADNTVLISQQQLKPIKLLKWKVSVGSAVSIGRVILLYDFDGASKAEQRKLKSTQAGTVHELIAPEGAIVRSGEPLLRLQACIHPTVMKDMCAECGADLRNEELSTTASVPMVHSIPDLKVSEEVAQKLGKADGERLIRDRKLVLLVDLDQTLIHTTNDNIPPNIKDVYHFQLYGSNSPWYHTRLRPGTHNFLSNISKFFELHICTFGARNYAHMIAMFLDNDQEYFSNRILSRDECFDPTSKKANLKALFPCGDDMVCIIDDREDVWNHATNLIHVKPYHFFKHTGDINAPPGLDKQEADSKEGVDLSNIKKTTLNGKNERKEENGVKDEPEVKQQEEKNEEEEEHVLKTNGSDLPVMELGEHANDNGVSDEKKEEAANVVTIETKTTSEKEEHSSSEEVTKMVDDITEEQTKSTNLISIEANSVLDKDNVIDKTNVTVEITDTATKVQNTDLDSSPAEIDEEIKIKSKDDASSDKEEPRTDKESKEDDLIEIEDADDYLLYLEDILKLVHTRFYEEYDKLEAGKVPDLKIVIPNVRSEILKGTKLVFSGLVPTHIKLEQSKAYQVARSLGASVLQDIDDDTTHLVAVRPGTAKVNAGRRKKHLKIVTPDWLWACAERWEHIDEAIYPLNSKGSKNRHPPPHCSSPEHVANYPTHEQPGMRKRTPSGRFMDTINPLMSFSSDDIADMDKEVGDILDDESDDDDEESNDDTNENGNSQGNGADGGLVAHEREIDDLEKKLLRPEEHNSSSSEESLTGEFPRGFKRMRDEHLAGEKADGDGDGDGEGDSTLDEFPSAKFRRGEQLDSDLDIGQESNSEGSAEPADEVDDGEWNMMGAALEREFLSNN